MNFAQRKKVQKRMYSVLITIWVSLFSWSKIMPIESIIVNGKQYSESIRFAYKLAYGLPKRFNCQPKIDLNRFEQCEFDAMETWSITIDDYVNCINESVKL